MILYNNARAHLCTDTVYAASVLAANSVLRSLFGTAFPLFTTKMYEKLGNQWASSIPAFLVLVCVPFPFLFYKYGPQIRTKSKYSLEAAKMLETMRHREDAVVGSNPVSPATHISSQSKISNNLINLISQPNLPLPISWTAKPHLRLSQVCFTSIS